MSVALLTDYKKNLTPGEPCQISFFGHSYKASGKTKFLNLDVVVDDGDYMAVLNFVVKNGGLGEIGDDGNYYFLPWPCAAVKIRPVESKKP